MADDTFSKSSSPDSLPPCGVYRTIRPIGDAVPAGRLVYFHNHGNPGPGVYLPERWEMNRAVFHKRGHTLREPVEQSVRALQPLVAEGFYRVRTAFHCCDKRCRRFEPGLFVQLGYDGGANPLLFTPELTESGITVPELGSRVDDEVLSHLEPVRLTRRAAKPAPTSVEVPNGHLH